MKLVPVIARGVDADAERLPALARHGGAVDVVAARAGDGVPRDPRASRCPGSTVTPVGPGTALGPRRPTMSERGVAGSAPMSAGCWSSPAGCGRPARPSPAAFRAEAAAPVVRARGDDLRAARRRVLRHRATVAVPGVVNAPLFWIRSPVTGEPARSATPAGSWPFATRAFHSQPTSVGADRSSACPVAWVSRPV